MAKFNLNQLLSDASLNSSNQGEQFKVVMLGIDELLPSKDNFYSVENILELKDSIEIFGIRQNLLVKLLPNDKYEIISGHRRHKACVELVKEGKEEYKFLPCVIESTKDDIKEHLLLIMSNSTTRQLTDWEKVQQAQEMRKLLEILKKRENISGRIRDLIAEALNVSPSHIGRIDAISNNLLPELQKALKEQQLSMSTAYEISGLPREEQKEILEEFQQKGEVLLGTIKAKKSHLRKEGNVSCNKKGKEKELKKHCEVGDCICPFCGNDFDGREATKYNLLCKEVKCPKCNEIIRISQVVKYICLK